MNIEERLFMIPVECEGDVNGSVICNGACFLRAILTINLNFEHPVCDYLKLGVFIFPTFRYFMYSHKDKTGFVVFLQRYSVI